MNNLNLSADVDLTISPPVTFLTKSGPVPERRESPRFVVASEVRFIRSKSGVSEVITGQIQDASLKGMRAILDRPVVKGEQLQIDVRTQQLGQFQIEVQVMWAESDGGGRFITGCEFCSILTLKQRAQLQRLAEPSLPATCRAAV